MSAPREKRLAGDVEDRPAPRVHLQGHQRDGVYLAEVCNLARGLGMEADRIRDQQRQAAGALRLIEPDADVTGWATSGSASILLWYRRRA